MSLVCYGAWKYLGGVKNNPHHYRHHQNNMKDIISMLVNLFAGLIAAYIAWNRNKESGVFAQVVISVLAFLFGFLYLLYLVGFVLLEDKLFQKTYLLNTHEDQLNALAAQLAA